MNTLRLALRMLSRDWRAGELTVLIVAMVLAVASIGTVGFFADRVKGALSRQANLLLGADVLISGDRPLPEAFAAEAGRRGLVVTPALKFNSMVQRARADGGGRRRRARRRQGGGAGLPAARRDHAGRSGQRERRTGARHSAARRSVARCPARGAARCRGRRCACGRRGDAHGGRDRPAGARGGERAARARAAAAHQHRRRSGHEPAAAGQSRRLSPARGRPVGARCARSLPRVAADRAEAGPAHGKRARPAARSAADARARGAVPGALGAGRGDPGRGRDRARRVALPAPPSRHRGDAPLPRRAAAPGARAVRAAVRGARRSRERCRHRHRAGGSATAGQVPGVRGARRIAGPRPPAGDHGIRHGHSAAVRLCPAAADRARERAAAARAAPRPAATAAGRDRCLPAGRGGHRAPGRLAGAGRESRRDHGRRHRRAARRRRARGLAPDPAAEAPAAARRDLALRTREPAPPPARVEPADRRAGARLHGAAAAHRRARRPDAELAREPAAGCAEPFRRQRAARPGRRRARRVEVGDGRGHDPLSDDPRPAGRGQRHAARHRAVRRRAGATARRARVQPVVGVRVAERPIASSPANGSPAPPVRRPASRWSRASPSRCA